MALTKFKSVLKNLLLSKSSRLEVKICAPNYDLSWSFVKLHELNNEQPLNNFALKNLQTLTFTTFHSQP